jgi:tRNA A37 threonylcarbamoyladenosine dehydratase
MKQPLHSKLSEYGCGQADTPIISSMGARNKADTTSFKAAVI